MYGLFFMLGSYFYLVYYRVEWLAFFSIFDTLQAFRYIFRCSIPKNPRAAHVFIFSFSRNHRDFKINILKFYLQIPTSFYFKECKKKSKIKYFLCPQKGHTCFCPGKGKKLIFMRFSSSGTLTSDPSDWRWGCSYLGHWHQRSLTCDTLISGTDVRVIWLKWALLIWGIDVGSLWLKNSSFLW